VRRKSVSRICAIDGSPVDELVSQQVALARRERRERDRERFAVHARLVGREPRGLLELHRVGQRVRHRRFAFARAHDLQCLAHRDHAQPSAQVAAPAKVPDLAVAAGPEHALADGRRDIRDERAAAIEVRDRLADVRELRVERFERRRVTARDRTGEPQVGDAQRAERILERCLRRESLRHVRHEIVVGDRHTGPGFA
jgi:hypothetical protein